MQRLALHKWALNTRCIKSQADRSHVHMPMREFTQHSVQRQKPTIEVHTVATKIAASSVFADKAPHGLNRTQHAILSRACTAHVREEA